jgi:hypothetical protein
MLAPETALLRLLWAQGPRSQQHSCSLGPSSRGVLTILPVLKSSGHSPDIAGLSVGRGNLAARRTYIAETHSQEHACLAANSMLSSHGLMCHY